MIFSTFKLGRERQGSGIFLSKRDSTELLRGCWSNPISRCSRCSSRLMSSSLSPLVSLSDSMERRLKNRKFKGLPDGKELRRRMFGLKTSLGSLSSLVENQSPPSEIFFKTFLISSKGEKSFWITNSLIFTSLTMHSNFLQTSLSVIRSSKSSRLKIFTFNSSGRSILAALRRIGQFFAIITCSFEDFNREKLRNFPILKISE